MSSQGETLGQVEPAAEEIQYKVINGSKHLSFTSIRRYTHGRLSDNDMELVTAHIDRCQRCRGIWEDLSGPSKKKKKAGWYRGAAIISVILITAALAVYFLTYDFGKPNLLSKQLSKAEAAKQIDPNENSEALAETPILGQVEETIEVNDPAEDIPEDVPLENEAKEQTVAFDPPPTEAPVKEAIVEEDVSEVPAPAVTTRKVYGKITLAGTGETLSGVNVMVAGSNQAKISNTIGGYNIQIPRSATELVFIYRGKKLHKKIDRNTSLVNVQLDLEKMVY